MHFIHGKMGARQAGGRIYPQLEFAWTHLGYEFDPSCWHATATPSGKYCVLGGSFLHTGARWRYLHVQSNTLQDVPSAGWMHDGWRFYDLSPT